MNEQDRSDQLASGVPSQQAPLSELQEWMTALIGHRRAIHKHAGLSNASQIHFSGNDRLSPSEQINIYRVQFWLRHTGILIDHFEGLSKWLGQERWQPIAESYLLNPDYSVFALADLGHRMAEHIGQMPAFEDQTLCVDLAQLEWAYQMAFSAADDPTLSLEKLTTIAPHKWAQARFLVSDSLHLLDLRYEVADLRRQLRTEDSQLDCHRPPKPKATKLVVYRRERRLYDKRLSTPAYLLLKELAAGVPLIPACEAVIAECAEAEKVFEEQLMHWFTLWGRLGWITDVLVEADERAQ